MAVPKNKVSKARRNTRNSANFKVAAPTLVECPQCHEKSDHMLFVQNVDIMMAKKLLKLKRKKISKINKTKQLVC